MITNDYSIKEIKDYFDKSSDKDKKAFFYHHSPECKYLSSFYKGRDTWAYISLFNTPLNSSICSKVITSYSKDVIDLAFYMNNEIELINKKEEKEREEKERRRILKRAEKIKKYFLSKSMFKDTMFFEIEHNPPKHFNEYGRLKEAWNIFILEPISFEINQSFIRSFFNNNDSYLSLFLSNQSLDDYLKKINLINKLKKENGRNN